MIIYVDSDYGYGTGSQGEEDELVHVRFWYFVSLDLFICTLFWILIIYFPSLWLYDTCKPRLIITLH